MKKFLTVSFILLCILSCKKNIDKQNDQVNNNVLPDLTTKVTASVSGFITGENNNPLAGVEVKAGTVTVMTDHFGFFTIKNTDLTASFAFVKATKQGYFTGVRTFVTKQGEETLVRIQLIPKTNSGDINAVSGGTVNLTDGSMITIPANAVVIAGSNNAYTGTIHVASHWIDPSNQKDLQATMPGNLMAIGEDSYAKRLTTFGMLGVELTGDAGELLQIATNSKATLNFPIPASFAAAAPSSIPLWYFDESNGLWKQDGVAVKNGNNYTGDVAHFSWWNVDIPYMTVNLSVQFVDAASQPLVNIPVSLAIQGQPNSAVVAYTNSNGVVEGWIPANANLVISIETNCNAVPYTQNITTASTNIDLGTIHADLAQYAIEATGSVNDCNNAPVTNGYVIIAGPNNVKYAAFINNGTYTVTFLDCLDENYTLTGVDLNTNNEGVSSSFVLSAGINNIAPMYLCGSPTAQYLVYSVDGTFYVQTDFPNATGCWLQHPDPNDPDTAITYIWAFNSGQQILSLIISNAPYLGQQSAIGGYGPLIWSPGTYGWIRSLDDTYIVNITEYGQAGEYIAGNMSFTGRSAYSSPGQTFAITVNFRVKRDG
ncbi:MAG: carboxypeptidase-like regulatory domain-containing protein [Ferruginibacter sp.]